MPYRRARLSHVLSLGLLLGAIGLGMSMPAAADEPAAPPAAGAPAAPADPGGPTKPAVVVTPLADVDKAPAPPPEEPRRSAPAKKRRGGINPCMTPDPGFGVYEAWSGTGMSMGQVLIPRKGGVSKSGAFDLVVHFHGHEPIRKEFVKTAKNIVLVGIDLGIGSGAYSSGFATADTWTQLVASVEAQVAKHAGIKAAHARKIALSSWSAGYGAIEQILRQTGGKNIDALILLDSLHTGYIDEQAKTLKTDQISPFVAFAKKAAAKQAFMFMSHSSIIPPGYASTTEVASYVVGQLHGRPKKANRQDVLGLDMIDRFDKGNFHMRGYTGDDKPDHCAHIGLMADIVRSHLEPRWKSPKGRK
ncbi:MAG: hypothetical protein U0359_30530 [Byssovorax sp.]